MPAPGGPGGATHAVTITPSDSTVFSPPLSAIWVGVTGNIAVLMSGDTVAKTFANVPVGLFDPGGISKVMATNTTATTMIGLY